MKCPLEDIEIALEQCPATACMYNNKGKCRYSEFKEALEGEDDPVQRLNILEKLGAHKDEVLAATRTIKAFIYTDRYCHFAVGKGLDSISLNDIELLKSEQRYLNWPTAKPEKFSSVQTVLQAIADKRGLKE